MVTLGGTLSAHQVVNSEFISFTPQRIAVMEEIVPPEFRLLGGILVSLVHWPEACWLPLNHLQPEHFADRGNRIIFEAVLTIHGDGVTVDSVSIAEYLNHQRTIHDAGGYVRLCDLWDWACPPNELPELVGRALCAGHQELAPSEVI